MSSLRKNSRGSEKPTAGDIAEVASGKGSSSDKAEVAAFGASSHGTLGRKAVAAIRKVGYQPRSHKGIKMVTAPSPKHKRRRLVSKSRVKH